MSAGPFELVTVPGGSRSLRSREHGETFHPGIGPMAEARLLHVAQHRFEDRVGAAPFVVWDVGLGAGANALAVIEAARELFPASPLELHSFDRTLEPLHFARDHAAELRYPLPWLELLGEFSLRHFAALGSLSWRLHLGDFRDPETPAQAPAPDAVIFDPYSPSANPGMWTREVFGAIRGRAEPGRLCTFSSYSRSTVTRANLLRAGWFVGRGVATGEKNETTVAATIFGALRDPLGLDWLERVRRSTAFGGNGGRAAGAEVAEELAAHPQFAG